MAGVIGGLLDGLTYTQYHFLKFASVYSEYRIEDSINALDRKTPHVFMIGLRIDFNKIWSKHIEL